MSNHQSLTFGLVSARLRAFTQRSQRQGVLNLNSEVGQRDWKAAYVGQTFLSASWGDFPVAPRPDWKVRRTGRLESLPHINGRGIAGPQL